MSVAVLRLDLGGLHAYQQNRHPYLLIDAADEVVPGVSASGHKTLAMLQIEAMVQLCALTVLTLPGNKGKVVYLASATNLKFSRKVVPGDRLDLETQLRSWKRGIGVCSGVGSVGGKTACRADFTIVMPAILQAYKVRDVSA
jgi:3-hydroxyacyl-[acyl-carrier-protein] dehydratase